MVYRNYAGTLLFQGTLKTAKMIATTEQLDKFKVRFSISSLVFKEQRYQVENLELKFITDADRKAFLNIFNDS